MKPAELRESMKLCFKLDVIGATKIFNEIDPEDITKLHAAYREGVETGGIVNKIQGIYNLLGKPDRAAIMDGEEMKGGVASLCLGLVILCRSKGITVSLEGI